MSEKAKIEIMDDGPLIVSDLKLLEDGEGNGLAIKKKIALCRCGNSENKPFCDGSHRRAGFKSIIPPGESSVPDKEGDTVIRSLKNGPYEVCGDTELCIGDDSGLSGDDPYYLCRCGASENKPFCDGSHKQIGFTDK
ncbi:MAG: hypothetical protein F4X55_04795 [Candidatus Dadabacteria bacterium]|nr:hypothetical protein [Candidatus Dadabacteria bacterium]MYC40313.1 hypothetical protein [Candidatus Dadabacteria bacterium]